MSPESHPDQSESSKSAGPQRGPESDLAWAAGFIDGEGCIHVARQRYRSNRADTYRLGVHVSQNDRGVLESLCEAVGIRAPIYEVKRAHNQRKQCYTLNFSGKNAMRLLILLGSYFRRKRCEAQAALDFWIEGRMGCPGPGNRCLRKSLLSASTTSFSLSA